MGSDQLQLHATLSLDGREAVSPLKLLQKASSVEQQQSVAYKAVYMNGLINTLQSAAPPYTSLDGDGMETMLVERYRIDALSRWLLPASPANDQLPDVS